MSSGKIRRLAVIPARGGSKRLSGKNVVDFLGKPIIAYTIDAALRTDLFARVVVSTDDAGIAEISEHFGAEVDDRPPELATDAATVNGVCLEFLEREEAAGRPYDVLCCLFATAPLRNVEDIQSVVGMVEPGRCDFAMAVTDYDLPPHQALKKNAHGFLEPMFPDIVNKKSQEIGPLLVDNGSTYAASVPAFRGEKTFYGPTLKGYVMPRRRSVDLDEAEDLEMLELFAGSSNS